MEKHTGAFKKITFILGAILTILLLMALAAALVFGAMWMKGKKELMRTDSSQVRMDTQKEQNEQQEAQETEDGVSNGETIWYQGKKYHRNQNLVSILCIGVDKEKLPEHAASGQAGQADALVLAVMDTETGELTLLNISRDSITEIDIYDVDGNYLKTERKQICLSFAYGDGQDKSCQNTRKAVSGLLYGMPIQGYAAIDLAAVEILNDAVGGVTLEILEDIPTAGNGMKAGKTMTLNGEQAREYIRWRDYKGEDAPVDANNNRMARQKQYMECYLKKVLERSKQNILFPAELFQIISENMVTNLTASRISYLASVFAKQGISGIQMLTVPGSIEKVDNYAEYYVDETALYQIILKIFYQEEAA